LLSLFDRRYRIGSVAERRDPAEGEA